MDGSLFSNHCSIASKRYDDDDDEGDHWRRYASSLNATKEYERRLHGSIIYMIKRMLSASTEG